jgi:hypothetical protein
MWWLRWTLVARDLFEDGWMKARPRRLVAARAWKSHWPVKISEGYDGRSGTEATVEPSAMVSRNQWAKIPDGRRLTGRRASIGLKEEEKKELIEELNRFRGFAEVGPQ